MGEYISFIAYWLLMMGLIGGALLLVQKFRPKKEEDPQENTDNEEESPS